MCLTRGTNRSTRERMFRYILVFSVLSLLAVVACVVASAADAPAGGQVVFAVSLGLFVAALAGGVTRSQRQQQSSAPAASRQQHK
jgi:uncharacterized membrane protein YtjA (UPF0391 family)